jgi:putative intracellular protease/amidase
MKNVYVFVFDGLADWEIGLITYELHTNNNIPVTTMGLTEELIKTGGGLTIQPDVTLAEVDPKDTSLLMLPGGEMWHTFDNQQIDAFIHQVHQAGGIVAGICAASLYLVKIGLMDAGIKHTSNGLDYLQYFIPDYDLQEFYVKGAAVSDQGIITAPGEAPFEFAHQILKALHVYDAEVLAEFAEFWRCR